MPCIFVFELRPATEVKLFVDHSTTSAVPACTPPIGKRDAAPDIISLKSRT